jgi:putative transposase
MREKHSNEAVESSGVCYETLEQWARGKIQAQLQQLLEEEVTTFLGRARHERRGTVSPIDPPAGSRNGYGKPRAFSMMSGTVTVQRPRVRDLTARFESKVLPLFTRRTQEVGTVLPELYLHGLSTGDFDLALRGLLGEGAPLSASSIQRLKARFELDYEAWKQRDLSGLEVVYWWADGLYVKAGIEDRKSALLTIVGALTTGEKIVLACESGERESKESWLKLLRDLKHRGLTFPQLTVADGHLGIWAAIGEIHPTGEEQRCWNHKIINVLDDLPKRVQQKAAEWLKAMPYAETKADCERRRDEFVRTYRRTEGKAVDTLLRDWARMVTFYSFPQEHWRHLRTTNIVESPFASVRLREGAPEIRTVW